MPLTIKPHTLVVRPPDAALDDLRRVNVLDHLPEDTRIMGKATPLGAEAVFKAFGVEMSEGYHVMIDLEDTAPQTGAPFVINALIHVPEIGEWLRVAQLPSRHGASALTSHATLLCQKASPPGDVEEDPG